MRHRSSDAFITIAETLLFRALRDRLGFTRLRSAATGGAALGPETFRFFRALGVPLRQLYGQTELVGAYTLHRSDDVDFDSVGVGFDAGIEMRIEAPNADGIGEIVTHHPNMFLGYYKASHCHRSNPGSGNDGARHTVLSAIRGK
jgi:long-chain acyl-CoA synthetase